MKKACGFLAVLAVLLAGWTIGWTIQHFGSTPLNGNVEARPAISAEDFTNDDAQRCKHAAPRHWSAMVLNHH